MITRALASLPNLAALATMLLWAATADEYHRLQPEPISLHMYGAILFAVVVWIFTRGLVWTWRG